MVCYVSWHVLLLPAQHTLRRREALQRIQSVTLDADS